MIVARRLELKSVDGVTMQVLENSDYDRRWQLRRDGAVLAETEVEGHVRAREWLAVLQRGEVAPITGSGSEPQHEPAAGPESDSEPEQGTLL